MPKRTNLKAVPAVKPEKLTWHQIDALARSVAFDLMGEHAEALRTLILLMQEIGLHSFDQGHVETISILVRDHLFSATPESDKAEKVLIERHRAEWMKVFEKKGVQ
jgi:hypothetical protein